MDEDGSSGPDELNCDVWAVVDFGHGPTEVACTMTGEHEEHACQVLFVEDDSPDPDMN